MTILDCIDALIQALSTHIAVTGINLDEFSVIRIDDVNIGTAGLAERRVTVRDQCGTSLQISGSNQGQVLEDYFSIIFAKPASPTISRTIQRTINSAYFGRFTVSIGRKN